MKTPGMKSSEFWVGILGAILAGLNEKFQLGIPVESFAIAGAYIISRGLAKWGTWDASGKS